MAKPSANVTVLWQPEDAQRARKERRGRTARLRESLAQGAASIAQASFVPSLRGIDIRLNNGVRIFLPLAVLDVHVLSTAQDEDLAVIETDDSFCLPVFFPRLDEGFSISGVLVELFREAARVELNRAAGKQTSPKKAAAARRNGRKGGRPKKKAAYRGK